LVGAAASACEREVKDPGVGLGHARLLRDHEDVDEVAELEDAELLDLLGDDVVGDDADDNARSACSMAGGTAMLCTTDVAVTIWCAWAPS
jgi:hypothetical protein